MPSTVALYKTFCTRYASIRDLDGEIGDHFPEPTVIYQNATKAPTVCASLSYLEPTVLCQNTAETQPASAYLESTVVYLRNAKTIPANVYYALPRTYFHAPTLCPCTCTSAPKPDALTSPLSGPPCPCQHPSALAQVCSQPVPG